MEMKLKKVRLDGKIVEEIEVPVYASIEEAIQDRGAELALEYINGHVAIKDMNACRDKHRPVKAGKGTKYFLKALKCISTDELTALAGDEQKMSEFLNSADVRKRVEEQLKAEGKTLEVEEDEDEDQENVDEDAE